MFCIDAGHALILVARSNSGRSQNGQEVTTSSGNIHINEIAVMTSTGMRDLGCPDSHSHAHLQNQSDDVTRDLRLRMLRFLLSW